MSTKFLIYLITIPCLVQWRALVSSKSKLYPIKALINDVFPDEYSPINKKFDINLFFENFCNFSFDLKYFEGVYF